MQPDRLLAHASGAENEDSKSALAGEAAKSLAAISNLRRLCATHLAGPLKRVIGTLSDTEKVLAGLELREPTA